MSSPDHQSTSLARLAAVLDELATMNPVIMTDQQVRDGLLVLLRGSNQLAGAVAAFAGSFDARGLSEADGIGATRSWMVAHGRMSQGAATGWVKRARLLREMPVLAMASRLGTVSAEHIAKVVDLEMKVGGVSPIKEYDDALTNVAAERHPSDVGELCEQIRADISPERPPPDPEAAFQRRALTFAPRGGMFALRGQLDPEGASLLRAALDALMTPPMAGDLRTAVQRRADAMIELARLSLGGGLPAVDGERSLEGVLAAPHNLARKNGKSAERPGRRGARNAVVPDRGNRARDRQDETVPKGPLDPLKRSEVPRLPKTVRNETGRRGARRNLRRRHKHP